MADNETTGTGKPVATDKVTYSGDADQNVQLVKVVQTTGAEGSKTVVDPAHDDVDGGNPLKIGGRASSTVPTAVSSGDRVNAWYGVNGQMIGSVGGVVTGADGISNGALFEAADQAGSIGPALVAALALNPSGTWDRMRGDLTNGLAIDVKRVKEVATRYLYNIASTVHVNSANTVMWDLFNADAALLVRVLSIRQIPNITTAVTGVVFDWLLERTTAVGTGGTAQTAWLDDTSGTALDADITARLKPTGGATQSTDLFNFSLSSEETNAATIQMASQGGLELVPAELVRTGRGILLRQNQGLRLVQITASAAGNTGWLIAFTVE